MGTPGARLRPARALVYPHILGALRHDQLTAPCVFDGPINGECFCAYVKHLLLPILREGDIVILDNLGSHKSRAVRQMI
jgi:putative transposase